MPGLPKLNILYSKRFLLRAGLYLFVTFHLSAIVLNSIGSTRDLYMRFNDFKETSSIFKFINKANFWAPFQQYARVSGTNCGFGFFAPNVRNNSVLVVQGCKNRLTPMFKTHEGEQRFDAYVGDLINDFMPKENQEFNVKVDSMSKQYNTLAIKNIALNVMKQNRILCDYFQVTYSVLDFPSMEETRVTGNADITLVPARILLLNRKSIEN